MFQKLKYLLLLLVVPLVSSIQTVEIGEVVVITNHDTNSVLMIDPSGELVYTGYDFRPDILTPPAAPGAAPGGGNIAGDLTDTLITKQEEAKEEIRIVETIRKGLLSATGAFFLLLLVGGFGGLVEFKEVQVEGRKLKFTEKLVYYGARPYRLVSDSKKVVKIKKEKDK